MTIVSLAVLVSMSAQLALSLKVISIQLIQTLAQSVVLVQMFVLLVQLLPANNQTKKMTSKAVPDTHVAEQPCLYIMALDEVLLSFQFSSQTQAQ